MPKLERLAIYSVRKVQAFYVVREIHKQIERSKVNLVTSPLGRVFETAKIIASE